MKFKRFDEVSDPFSGVDIDAATKLQLSEYFSFDRISDTSEAKWKWLFKRRLNMLLPIYEQQLSMWKEYRAEEWFYDKIKVNEKKHDEWTNLTETQKQTLIRTLNETIDRTAKETYENSQNLTGKDTTGQTDKTTSTSSGTFDENTKDRQFNFQYPESNYTGGVIPYDINSNPSVEFISTQGDRIGLDHQTSNSESDTDYSSDVTKDTTQDVTENSTKNNTDNETRDESQNDDTNFGRDQKVTSGYTDHYDYDGSNIIDLAQKLIDLLPQANFFKELVDGLYDLFNHTWYNIGWCDEEDEDEYI